MMLGHQQQQFQNEQFNATNNKGQTPFHVACLHCNSVAVIQLLLEYSTIIDNNATDNYGNTPLHYACSSYDLYEEYDIDYSNYHPNIERISIIKKLLEQPWINIYKKNDDGITPVDMCKYIHPREPFKFRNYVKKQLHNEIIELFEDHYIQRRWQIYCFLMKSLLIKDSTMRAAQNKMTPRKKEKLCTQS